MRTCRWCGSKIRYANLGGFGAFWILDHGPGVIAGGAAVCDERAIDRDGDGEDEHNPVDLDLPPALDVPTLEEWLDAH